MDILIACEESQVICKAFRSLGHDAFSCDLVPCSGGHPEWHFQCDVRELLNYNWDLIIAHPPCTYLSNAGARWLYPKGILNINRYNKGLVAKEFFMLFYNNKCSHICIENPLPSKIFNIPDCSQIIQPYLFGEHYSKKTLLWLKGLPSLIPTEIVDTYIPYINSSKYSYTHCDLYKGVSRSGGSSRVRSRTFDGIASAMACQWSKYLLEGN